MWAAIFGLIASLPQLLSLFEKLIAWLSEQIEQAKTNQAKKEMDAAIEKAKTKKDTSSLDHLFDSNKKETPNE